jgi:CBS-domain-containing membrane protein
MNTSLERLQTIRVADAMSRDVVTVSANATLAEAARLLTQHEVSGVPVTDELGQCVGVLSAADFVKKEQAQEGSSGLKTLASEHMLVRDEGSGAFEIEHVAENLVKEFMSSAPQTIVAEQSLIDAAKYMLGEHIHRLIVVDKQASIMGVISALDILAALVNVADEQASI